MSFGVIINRDRYGIIRLPGLDIRLPFSLMATIGVCPPVLIVGLRIFEKIYLYLAICGLIRQHDDHQVCNLDGASKNSTCLAFEAVKEQQAEGLHRLG